MKKYILLSALVFSIENSANAKFYVDVTVASEVYSTPLQWKLYIDYVKSGEKKRTVSFDLPKTKGIAQTFTLEPNSTKPITEIHAFIKALAPPGWSGGETAVCTPEVIKGPLNLKRLLVDVTKPPHEKWTYPTQCKITASIK